MNIRTDEEAPRRGRPPKVERQDAEQERRRKRGGVQNKRIGYNLSQLDVNNYKYRVINDDPGRMYALTKEDDYAVVHQDGSDITDQSEMGSAVCWEVGKHPNGSPKMAYLCRKKIEWYKADQEEKTREIERQIAEMRRGNDRNGASQSDYVPSTGIRI